MHTTHTSRSQSQGGSHVSHDENTRSLQLEIDRLRRRFRCEGLPQILTLLLRTREMVATGPSLGLLPTSIFLYDEDLHYG